MRSMEHRSTLVTHPAQPQRPHAPTRLASHPFVPPASALLAAKPLAASLYKGQMPDPASQPAFRHAALLSTSIVFALHNWKPHVSVTAPFHNDQAQENRQRVSSRRVLNAQPSVTPPRPGKTMAVPKTWFRHHQWAFLAFSGAGDPGAKGPRTRCTGASGAFLSATGFVSSGATVE